MNKKYRVSVVSYLNTLPFIYGLELHKFYDKAEISLDYPSVCAEKLLKGEVDIGLIPVALLPELTGYKIISDYCIGSKGKVRSVLLYSNTPLEDIWNIKLDYQSRTSVQLLKLLAKKYWKIEPEWTPASPGYEDEELLPGEAALIIGDRSFKKEKQHPYIYDLSEEWYKFTGLPFVFATWTANKEIDPHFTKEFNKVLGFGLNNIPGAVEQYNNKSLLSKTGLQDYLENNISYQLDKQKKQALDRFLEEIKGNSYLDNQKH